MRFFLRFGILSLIACLFALNAHSANDKTLTVITHEAAPWMAEKLPDGGAIFYALKKVLEKKDYNLKVIFAPSWIRAKMDAVKKSEIDAYFPIRTIEHEDVFMFTDVMFESPWSIAERKDHPILFRDLQDLKRYTAGNVQGVELRPGIEDLVKQGLKVETTSSQENNLLKLATGRVDFIFIDKGVYRFTLAMEPSLKQYRDKLQLNAKPIVVEKYKLALKKKNVPKEFVAFFNSTHDEFNKHLEDYYKMLETKKP
ncbi:substrate-binding periplasmic protein [Bdellovibrio reynosensis]|uniref:ABC transporter substrate-binding protein n=1 Tax=Bdellovibrio reynosensis TaxID=2835041 RepID=A0ABY4CIY7_9BACT|nr:ABC transporter substrate-binding protein [Bdellovibrio reynosensis]UOF02200.1 ABC transporter substrate-binding protein [Bdellovibrio reynosensis]